MIKFILLFTVIPLLELMVLVKLSTLWGLYFTIGLIVITGIVGAIIIRNQQLKVLAKIKETLNEGQMPADELISAVLIIIGSGLLLTPGPITDLAGFLCVIPLSRRRLRELARARFVK